MAMTKMNSIVRQYNVRPVLQAIDLSHKIT